MLRMTLSSLLITIGIAGLSHGQVPKDESRSSATPTLIPDPDWKPRVGDRVTVQLPDSPALPDLASCERYIKFSRANDAVGMRELMTKSSGKTLAVDTPVLVVQPHGLPVPRMTGTSVGSLESAHADMQDALFRAASRPRPVVSIEARILDGPLKDSLRFIPMESLARMVDGPPAPTLHPGDRAIVAATSIPMGRDEEAVLEYPRQPEGSSNRPYPVQLSKGARVTILEVNKRTYQIKVNSNSKFAGRVGYVKFEGLRLVDSPTTNSKQVK